MRQVEVPKEVPKVVCQVRGLIEIYGPTVEKDLRSPSLFILDIPYEASDNIQSQ